MPDFMSDENVGRIMAAARDVEFHSVNDDLRGVLPCT